MANKAGSQAPFIIVFGGDAYLNKRTGRDLIRRALHDRPDAERIDLDATGCDQYAFDEAVSPSLLADVPLRIPRTVVRQHRHPVRLRPPAQPLPGLRRQMLHHRRPVHLQEEVFVGLLLHPEPVRLFLDLLGARHPDDRRHLRDEEDRRDDDECVQPLREAVASLRDEDRRDDRPRDEGDRDDEQHRLAEGRDRCRGG